MRRATEAWPRIPVFTKTARILSHPSDPAPGSSRECPCGRRHGSTSHAPRPAPPPSRGFTKDRRIPALVEQQRVPQGHGLSLFGGCAVERRTQEVFVCAVSLIPVGCDPESRRPNSITEV